MQHELPKHRQTILFCFFTLVLTVIQAGCAGTALSLEDRARIKTVSVSERDIEVPEELYYFGPGQAALNVLGVAGGLAGASAAEGPKAKLKEITDREAISVRAIMLSTVKRKVQELNTFKLVESGADAQMKIKITRYGLRISEPMASTVKPWISAEVSLVRSPDSVVFQGKYMPEVMSGKDFAQVYPLEKYLENPALFRTGLEKAADIVVGKMIDELR